MAIGGTDPRLAAQWARIRGMLRREIGDAAFKSWMSKVILVEKDETVIRLATPTRFMSDFVEQHYGERLAALWREEDHRIAGIEIAVQVEMVPPTVTRHVDKQPAPRVEPPPAAAAAADEPGAPCAILNAALDPRFTFEAFVVGKPNELAFAAARRVAEAPKVQYNPLFLYGGVGLGKTHLMHAIAWHIRTQTPERKVVYLSAEQFMHHFITAIRYKNTHAFKDQFRSVDVLMIDDVQFINGGKESTQEEFFHTFNALVDSNRQVIVSADKSPSDLEDMEERLRSRLGWGLVADIHATTYELRLGILQAKAELQGIAIPEDVLKFLAHKITTNVRELEGALNRIVAHSVLIGRDITVEMCQDALRDLLKASERRVTIDEIQKRVAEHFNIRLSDMGSERRSRAVARPRQVAMYLAKQLTTRSLPEIGRKFGGRDHTTVMHAVRKIEELQRTDPNIAEDVQLLRKMLEQ